MKAVQEYDKLMNGLIGDDKESKKKSERKEKPKKRKKDKSKKHQKRSVRDEELIELIGGMDVMKELGEGLLRYIELLENIIIVPDEGDLHKKYKKAKKAAHDMTKGETYMLSIDGLERHYARVQKGQIL